MSERGKTSIAKPLKTILALAVVALATFGITVNDWVPDELKQAVERLRGGATNATPLQPVTMNAASDSYGPTTWYFAQGKAQDVGDTWLLLANPGTTPVTAAIKFFDTDSQVGSTLTAAVPAGGRTAVHVDEYVTGSFATAVSASAAIVVEESVFFAGDAYTVQGVATPSTIWYLPEGTTDRSYDTSFYVFNPASTAADVAFTFYDEKGGSQTATRSVGALSQLEVKLTDACTNLSGGIGTVITATTPVVVQRVTFFANGAGGHASMGVSLPSNTWYFPLARAGTAYDSWLMLLNPTSSSISIATTYQSAANTSKTTTYTVAAHSRKTIWIDNPLEDQSPAADFAIRLTGDGTFAAESVIYTADYATGEASNGAPGPAATWYFAEGSTADPYDMYLVLYNPGTTGALIRSTLLPAPSEGATPSWALTPGQMTLAKLNGQVPAAPFGIAIYSDVPIVAARLLDMTPGLLGGMGLPALPLSTSPVAYFPHIEAPRAATAIPTPTLQPDVTPTPIQRAGIATYVLAAPIDGTANCGSTGLKGYVKDANGNPVQGERVRVWADGWAGGLSNETDATGYWDFTLGNGAIAGNWYAAVSEDNGTLLSPTVLMPTSADCRNGQQWVQATWRGRTGTMPTYYLAWSRHLSCAENGGNHHLFIDVTDANGNGLADVAVRVAWGNTFEDLLTGNKLDVGPGRVEFAMYKGTYSARVYLGTSDTASDLSNLITDNTTCTNGGNTLYHNSYHVVFRRQS